MCDKFTFLKSEERRLFYIFSVSILIFSDDPTACDRISKFCALELGVRTAS